MWLFVVCVFLFFPPGVRRWLLFVRFFLVYGSLLFIVCCVCCLLFAGLLIGAVGCALLVVCVLFAVCCLLSAVSC